MPMMRRGPLDRYPVEWVLRQASSHQVDGSIEFHTSEPSTFFLRDGRIYAAEHGVGAEVAAGSDPSVWQDEAGARAQVVAVLASTLPLNAGWYYHDPLGHHASHAGTWVWETATLLMDTRARVHEHQTLAAWTERTVQVQGTSATSVIMGADAWSVVVALTDAAEAAELRARLGWSPARVLSAITELEQLGLLAGQTSWQPDLAAARAESAVMPPPLAAPPDLTPALSGTSPTGRHTGPLAPPPVLPVPGRDGKGAKGRKLPGRRA